MYQCDSTLRTACFVTGTFGFVVGSCNVVMIALNELMAPTIPDKQ